jgi:hypothetical protein
MKVIRSAVNATLLAGLIAVATTASAQPPVQAGPISPTDAEVRELKQQVDALQRQLDELKSAKDNPDRQRLMRQNWQGMQGYMGQMHDRWGMGYPWMQGRPWMHCGPGMMGGNNSSWPMPSGLTPDEYNAKIGGRTRQMQEQMDKIARTTDPKERQRLMQEHWQGMYQDMQTMRGMGWMWGNGHMMGRGMMGPGMMGGEMVQGGPPPSGTALPDSGSAGAKLVLTYCTQCHAAPQPTLHTATQWTDVTQRMQVHMQNGWRGIRTPADGDMKAINAYMQKHARR